MPRTARLILYGLTLGVLLALLVAPQSGWLVRFQALPLLRFAPLPGHGPGTSDEARERAVAAASPDDYQLQFASVRGSGTERTEGLRQLEARFPNNPSLRANILRVACLSEVRMNREEDYLLLQMPLPRNYQQDAQAAARRVDPLHLAAFDQDAAAGERLDPDNAYFPLMRAMGLYAEHRDAEARGALLRAGTKPQWKEYYDDEVAGETRLHALAFGDHSAVWDVAVAASVLLPQYAHVRQITRIATYQAMQEEQTGRVKDGIALRHALIHCGDLMRVRSQSGIGSLVGIAMTRIAMSRPGGAPLVKAPSIKGADPNDLYIPPYPSVTVTSYAAYLRRSGFVAEAQQALAVDQANRQAAIVIKALAPLQPSKSDISPFGRPMRALLVWWIAGLLVLANAFWLLTFGGLARLRKIWTATRGWMLAISGTLAFALIAFLAWRMTLGTQEFIEYSAGFDRPIFSPLPLPSLATGAALAIPILTLLIVAIVSRTRQVSVADTMAAAAVPMACLVLLAYGGIVFGTVRQERAVNDTLTQSLRGEGAYVAARTGQAWPGVVE